jgi:hypothetical protein
MSEATLHKGSDMTESEPVTWLLAPGYLAAGKVNLLVGDEGIGKSLFAIRAMASISTGKPWGPFTIASDPSDVILIATEDGWSDTIRPRLELADADLDHIHVFSEGTDGTGIPTFPADMDRLREQSTLITPSLVVVDAWIDTVPGGLEVKDTQKARRAVAPWKAYAAETNSAVLLVAHTNRGEHQNLRNTYGLSVALRQVARSTIYAAEDPDTHALVVGPEKSNLGGKVSAERFQRTPVPVFEESASSDGTVPRLDYLGNDGRTINEVVADHHSEEHREKMTDECDSWLRKALEGGAVRATELYEQAEQAGFSVDQVKRSRRRIGAVSRKLVGVWYVQPS